MNIKIIPEKIIYYNEDNNFGIVACTSEDNTLKKNPYGNITIKGCMPRLRLNIQYEADVEEKIDKKYGVGYEINYISEITPTTIEDERKYLEAILTQRQVEEIYKVYPNESVIELMLDNKFDYDKVKGIGDYTYNKIKTKIIDNIKFQKALVQLSKFGVSYNMIVKLVERYGNVDIVIDKIKKNPYILADEVIGIGFKKCDEYALKNEIEKDSSYRINAGINYILSQEANNNGHSWISINNLMKQAIDILDLDNNTINKHIYSDNLSKNIYIDNNKVALQINHYYEKKIYEKLLNLLSIQNNFEIDDIENKIKNIEEQQGFTFTDEQKKAIYMAIKYNILVINGSAGTGKSSLLKGILGTLNNYSYATCALSGKASQRIIESTGLESQTIHRLLGYNPRYGWLFNENNPLMQDIVVLDEASMVDNSLFYRLITSVKNGSKFIILADIEQLEPIGAGFIVKDLIDSDLIPKITLTKIHRQAQKSGILSVANTIRQGIQIVNDGDYENKIFGELKDLYFRSYKSKNTVYKDVINICKNYKGNILDFQVIVPLKNRGNLCTKNLNIELQNIFNPNKNVFIKYGKTEFRLNDKVIQCGNNYDTGVFNGTIGKIVEVDVEKKSLKVDFDMEDLIEYTAETLKELDLAYALSIHRFQGSQINNVLFALDYSSYILLSKQLIYTAITRAIKRCIICCELDAFRHGVSVNKANKRNTFLKEFLYSNVKII